MVTPMDVTTGDTVYDVLVNCCNETIVVGVASMLWVLASVKLEDEASVLGSSQFSMCYGIIDLHVLKVLEGTPQWLSLRTHAILCFSIITLELGYVF